MVDSQLQLRLGAHVTHRISYREFRDELLLSIAIMTQGETNKFVNPEDASRRIRETYSPSWQMSAVKDLRDDGYLTGKTFISGGGSYALLGAGLERAEEIANEQATDLYDLIEEADAASLPDGLDNRFGEHGNTWEGSETDVIKIDHLSPDFRSLDRALRDHIEIFRGNNELLADSPEARRHLAELEAGKALLKADEADRSLVKKLLLPALTWFVRMARDETTKALIKKLIDDVSKWLL